MKNRLSNNHGPLALPAETLRRKRLTFAVVLAACAPLIGLAVGAFISDQPASAPLLLAVDERPLDRGRPMVQATLGAPSERHSSSFVHELFETSTESADRAGHDAFVVEAVRSMNRSEVGDSVQWFNGRPVRSVRTMRMLVTAYSPDERSCGESADGMTASGYSVWTNAMKMVAADTDLLPFGTLVSVPGYDNESVVPVLDRGAAIKGHRLDVLFPTDERAMHWGAQRLDVTIWEYADGLPNDFKAIYNSASAIRN